MRGASTISAILATSAALLISETGFGSWYVQSQMVLETQQQHRHHYPVLSSTPFVPLNMIFQSSTEVGDPPGTGGQPGIGSPVDKEGTDSILLPDGFQIGYGPIGFSIVWSPPQSSHIQLRMGNARPEFRLSSSLVFGYPREINNQLHMTLSNEQKEQLVSDGMKLEVWKSGKRLDIASAETKTIPAYTEQSSKVFVLESTETGGYDSIPPDTPKINVDPAARGNYTTRRLSYNLTALTVRLYPIPIEVLAEVYLPRRAIVKSPLVLIIHGRHDTCYKGGPNGESDINWPCLSGFQPIPSYKGYRYIGDLLASQGYVAVSISSNGINGQEYLTPDWGAVARSKLIRHHLKLLAKWSTDGGDPWNNAIRGKLDMDRVVLVGHSRGGEGVHVAAIEATTTDPFKIVGLVTYGPTAFGMQVTPDVHSATLLPTCDGDISNLDGQAYIDHSRDIAYSEALRTAVTVLGANNNYFNTEWTPGISQAPSYDDWAYNQYDGDPVCGTEGSLRLTPQEQRNVATAYTAALLRLSVYQDIAMLPLLDGSFVRPVAIGRAEVATSAVGGAANRLLYIPGEGSVRFQNGMKGFACSGRWSYTDSQSIPRCASDNDYFYTPHFQSLVAPPPLGYELEWTSSIGAVARFNLRSGVGNLVGYDWIDLRIGNDPNKPPIVFDVVISDSRGKNVTLLLNTSIIDGWPGTGSLDRMQARTLRGQLPKSMRLRSMVDLARIKAVSLVTRTASGRVWLLDIAASKNEIVTPTVLNLPVVSIDNVVVQEGSTYGTAKVKVRVSPTRGKTGEVWLRREYSFDPIQINITAGSPSILHEIPLSWTGNNVYNYYDYSAYFLLEAKKGVVIGHYAGGLTVLDDDPMPILSAVSNSVTVTEGAFLRWTLKHSSLSSGAYYTFRVIPPATGNELFTDDVDQRWIESRTSGFPVLEPMPLSSVNVEIYVDFNYGESTTDIIVPIAVDNKAETNETVTLELMSRDWSWNPLQPAILLTGTVLAHK